MQKHVFLVIDVLIESVVGTYTSSISARLGIAKHLDDAFTGDSENIVGRETVVLDIHKVPMCPVMVGIDTKRVVFAHDTYQKVLSQLIF